MDATPSGRSFKHLGLSLIVLGFVTSGVSSLARARDPVAADRGARRLDPDRSPGMRMPPR